MRSPKPDNYPEPGCGTETSGIGAPKKQEGNVKDVGSVTPQLVVKEKCLKGSRKRECRRNYLNQREWKTKARDTKKRGKEGKEIQATYSRLRYYIQ